MPRCLTRVFAVSPCATSVGAATGAERAAREALASSRRFFGWLAGIVAVGVIIRVYYTVRIAPWPPAYYGDEAVFRAEALSLLHGHGFLDINATFRGEHFPGASHPPLYPFVLAVVGKLGGTGEQAQRLAGTVFGAGTIVVLGLLGRRLGGNRVGLLAAGLAAVYPTLVAADGALMSESLYGLLIGLCLLAAYRLLETRGDARAVVLGALLGLAALTRGEALLLIPLILVPVARRPRGRRAIAITCLTAAVVVAPWSVRNWSAFHRPVLISTNLASAVAGANCHSTYYTSALIGSWDNSCIKDYPGNEAVRWGRAQADAVRYATHHLTRLPVVGVHRLLRAWGLERSEFPVVLGGSLPQLEGRSPHVSEIGFVMYDVLVVLSVWGFVVLRRRGVALWTLMTTFMLVSVCALLIYGDVRFREPAELSLVVLAATALDQLWRRLTTRHSSNPDQRPSAQASTASLMR
jgi:4-amino-4-deoxy-L-arabinose transferase-like glycosyltransferase